ncbi:aminotransferase class V-fold PLP-dependent enzyme [Fulvivirga sp.]|uniref:aminotransferase class V-fold PLP-dependent enzyme n=1 Tax=Fulvivirga sp. TaxID=1931237 RepID=UPI0032EFDEC6
MDKRAFIKNMSALSLGIPFSLKHIEEIVEQVSAISPNDLAGDEEFWKKIRGGYKLKEDYINLENGYYCFMPQETLEHYISHIREVNLQGSYYMRTVQWDNQEAVTKKLADLAGCSDEELIITRNTTESLDMIIAGQDWEEGDEAIMAEQDYGSMQDQFHLMEKRYGIVTRVVSVPNHPKSDEEIVQLYADAITERTKLLMICHLINITGQVLPVKKICDMAHEKGVEVMVDGAHAFAHLDFKLDDLNCDYYGTSLHKWLSVPLGAGFLYVKKEKVSKIWPLMAQWKTPADDIFRLNHTGTHPVHTHLAISNAIDYHNAIGSQRKEARLKFLQHYWTSKVRNVDNVIVNTPEDMTRHGAIGNVGIKGMEPHDLAKKLMEDHKIWTVSIYRPEAGVLGVRVTPNVYTTLEELDAFVKAIKELAKA